MSKRFPDATYVKSINNVIEESRSKRPRLEHFEISEISTIPPPLPQYQYDSFQHVIAVAKSGSDIGELKWPRGVAFHQETRHICVADSFNQRINIFSENGNFVDQFGSQFLLRPCGILIHKNITFVTDQGHHAIFQFPLADPQMIKRFGKEGSGNEEFNSPNQLAISPNQQLYVTDRRNNRVQILDFDFTNYKGTLKHQSMTQPVDIRFSNNEILVLSCWDNPCMHIFTLSGVKLRSVITRGDGMQVRRAYFFCLDARGNIIISDSTDDNVKVFSLSGDLMHIVGGKGQQPGMFSSPSGVAILNQTGLVCVSENCYYGLQILYF